MVRENGTVTFYGSNRWLKLHYAVPLHMQGEKAATPEPYFNYRGRRYYLDEFMATCASPVPEYMKEFDGYDNDSFFSGVAVKTGEDNYGEVAVKAFTFIS